MDIPPLSDFYPQRFSWRMDVAMALGTLCAGLALVSATAQYPVVSKWYWLGFSICVYVFAGFFYARRSGDWKTMKNRVMDWTTWILCLCPMLAAWGLTALFWAAGGLADQEALGLAVGTFAAAFVGPVTMFGVVLICRLISLWMEQAQPNS